MKKRDYKQLLKLAYVRLNERTIPLKHALLDMSSGLTIIPRVNGVYISRDGEDVWFDTYYREYQWVFYNYTGGKIHFADVPTRLKKFLPANGKCRYIRLNYEPKTV